MMVDKLLLTMVLHRAAISVNNLFGVTGTINFQGSLKSIV